MARLQSRHPSGMYPILDLILRIGIWLEPFGARGRLKTIVGHDAFAS